MSLRRAIGHPSHASQNARLNCRLAEDHGYAFCKTPILTAFDCLSTPSALPRPTHGIIAIPLNNATLHGTPTDRILLWTHAGLLECRTNAIRVVHLSLGEVLRMKKRNKRTNYSRG